MSGFEVVGVVLATLPLVISAIQACAMAKRFCKYKLRLEVVVRNFESESVQFVDTCEMLLDGLVYDSSQLEALLKEPNGEAWGDIELQKKIKGRLRRAFVSFGKTMDDIHFVTEQFRNLFVIGANGQPELVKKSKLKRFLKKFKLSVKNSSYDDLIQRFKNNNDTLLKITEKNIYLESGRVRRSRSLPNFEEVRRHAANLHQALARNFRCECKPLHTLSLLLEGHSNRYEVPFYAHEQARAPTFRVIFSSNSRPSLPPTNQWEFELTDVMTIHKASQGYRPLRTGIRRVPFTKRIPSTDTPAPTPSQWQARHPQIQDLCTAMGQLWRLKPGSVLGSIGNEFNLSKPKESICGPNSPTRVSLSEVVLQANNAKGVQLRLMDRLRLAVVLGYSLLQLHPTPWISGGWSAENIYFLKGAGTSQLWELFLERPCIQDVATARDTPISDPLMQENIRYPRLFELGVMLIELYFQESFQVLRKYYRSGDIQGFSLDPNPNPTDRLLNAVRSTCSSGYADAVETCIRGNLRCHLDALSDEDFCQFVFYKVIVPLEEDLDHGYTPDDTIAECNNRIMGTEDVHLGVDEVAKASNSSKSLETPGKETNIILGCDTAIQRKFRERDTVKLILVIYAVSSLVLVFAWWLKS